MINYCEIEEFWANRLTLFFLLGIGVGIIFGFGICLFMFYIKHLKDKEQN